MVPLGLKIAICLSIFRVATKFVIFLSPASENLRPPIMLNIHAPWPVVVAVRRSVMWGRGDFRYVCPPLARRNLTASYPGLALFPGRAPLSQHDCILYSVL